ncbi:MAG: carbohydrate-binding protein, partial [Thomasclavelia spiroformis]
QLDEFEKITLEDLKNLVTYSESLDLSSVHIEIIKNIEQKLTVAREVINQEVPDEKTIEEAYYGLQNSLDKIDSNRLAYDKQEAEIYDENSGIVNDGPNIGSLNPGDWVCYKNVIFDSNANFFELYYSAETITQCGNPLIEVRLDSTDNEPIVTFVPNKTGTWKNYVYSSKKFESIQNIKGIHDVYLTFSGEILPAEIEGLSKQNVANIDWFSFSEIITPTVIAQNGIITNENLDVKYGEDLVITFTPEEGYVYDQVLIDGQVYDGKVENNSITLVNVKKAHQVEVIFKLIDYKETDKIALKIALDLANAITDKDLENVVPVVVNEFKQARDKANEVYNDASASQDKVDAAFDRLASVMQKLEFFKGDKTALKAFIDKVSGLEAAKYTEATWTPFNDALKAATRVYEDENAMQEEVNNVYNELVTAFLKLRLIPD